MRLIYIFAFTLFVLLISTVQAGIYSSSDPVTILTDSNFDKLVLKSDEVWVVEFYGDFCGHCKTFAPEYLKSAKSLKGIVKYGVVDGQAQQSLASKYSIQGFPTVKIFAGAKSTPVEFQGQRDAKTLSQAVLKEVRETVSTRLNGGTSKSNESSNNKDNANANNTAGGKVIELTASTFNSKVLQSAEVWLVAFTATWCGHCKSLKPNFAAAAKQFSPDANVRFANIDCPSHEATCQQYSVKGYPTIKMFYNGKPTDYNGGRSTEDFVTFMKNQGAKSKPTPKPVELLSQEQLDKCLNEQVCIFASLPDIRDSSLDERKKHIQILTDAAVKNKQHNIQWVYSFARTHRDLENTLQMGQNGFPAIVLINKAKSLYSPLYRAFTLENVSEWATTAGNGRVTNAQNYKELPTLTSVKAWDGKATIPKEEL